MQLSLARKPLGGDSERRVVEVMHELVNTIRTLRAAVFELQRPLDEESFPDAVHAVVAAASRALGHTPAVTLTGDLERVPGALRADVVAALQEALSNVIRHAASTAVYVTLDVSPAGLVLTVEDDGVGVDGPRRPGQGLLNLAVRAEAAGGSSVLESRVPRGTLLTWSVPLTDTP